MSVFKKQHSYKQVVNCTVIIYGSEGPQNWVNFEKVEEEKSFVPSQSYWVSPLSQIQTFWPQSKTEGCPVLQGCIPVQRGYKKNLTVGRTIILLVVLIRHAFQYLMISYTRITFFCNFHCEVVIKKLFLLASTEKNVWNLKHQQDNLGKKIAWKWMEKMWWM